MGKRYNDLWPQVTSWENLVSAWGKARKGKRSKPPAAAFEMNAGENLLQLQGELLAKTYRPGAYHSFTIHEPKRRLISAAPFRDRVVHHALCNVIEPLFERRFIGDCYANRVGKGTHRALDRCQAFAQRYRYVLQCDVEQFFPAIDHVVLRDKLAHVIGDPDVLWLIDGILESGAAVLGGMYDMRWFRTLTTAQDRGKLTKTRLDLAEVRAERHRFRGSHMSPKVLEEGTLIFWFHSYDTLHEERASVHVGKGSQDDYNDAKIWLEPEIEVARPGRTLRRHELNRALRVIEQYYDYLLEVWYDYKRRAG